MIKDRGSSREVRVPGVPIRLNVATSSARCICILVAALRVLEPDCRSPQDMWWANGLCRFRELAERDLE